MRILLAGHFSYFIRTLRDRFRKEGHEVFWLSGADYERRKEKGLSWQYDFSFESPSMPEIINSADPDVVIFTGAADPYYGNFSDGEKAREYSSGLINILQTTYSREKRARFIYISSEEVFGGCEDGVYNESTACAAFDERGRAIRQGEQTVLSFKESADADIYILRIDHIFGLPVAAADMPYSIAPFIRTALREDRIDASKGIGYGMLSEEDASFFILRIAETRETADYIYHLGSEEFTEETDIATAINAGFHGRLTVEAHDYGRVSHRRLSPERFDTEFNTSAFHKPAEEIEKIAETISAKRKQYSEYATGGGRGIREALKTLGGLLVPFIENVIVFIPVFLLNNHFSGGAFFSYVDFYLLYVLLFAVAFGQQQAAFSAVLATIGFFYRQQLHMSGFEVVVDYNTYIWIAQIFIVGLVVGNLKDRITLTKEENERQIEYLKSRLSDVETVNTANVRIKGVLEKQIINQEDSLGRIYQITSRLDNSSPVEVLFDAAQVVEELMESGDVAIYQVTGDKYARLFASTSELARSMGNSIVYPSYEEMYEAISTHKVFINRSMTAPLPMMASGVWSGRQLNVIIMVWGLAWENMTLSEADRLTVIGLLIQNAISTSTRYIDALQEKRYMPDLDVLEDSAFEALLNAFVNAKKRHLTDVTLMWVKTPGDVEVLAPAIRKQLRASDFIGMTNRGAILILLSNTDYNNAMRVRKRLADTGIQTEIIEADL